MHEGDSCLPGGAESAFFMTYANKLTITTLFTLGLGGALAQSAGCVLVGIEPDEIDIAEDDTGTEGGATAGEDEIGGTGDTGADTGNDGTTDVGTTEGGTDTTGDGDTTGTSDTGTTGTDDAGTETGGDTGTTGGEDPCNFGVDGNLVEGAMEVELLDVASAFESECGGTDGPELVYTFSSPEGGLLELSLASESFGPVLYTITNSCDEPATNCSAENPAVVQIDLAPDELVYVVVDSDGGTGLGTLTVTLTP